MTEAESSWLLFLFLLEAGERRAMPLSEGGEGEVITPLSSEDSPLSPLSPLTWGRGTGLEAVTEWRNSGPLSLSSEQALGEVRSELTREVREVLSVSSITRLESRPRLCWPGLEHKTPSNAEISFEGRSDGLPRRLELEVEVVEGTEL